MADNNDDDNMTLMMTYMTVPCRAAGGSSWRQSMARQHTTEACYFIPRGLPQRRREGRGSETGLHRVLAQRTLSVIQRI